MKLEEVVNSGKKFIKPKDARPVMFDARFYLAFMFIFFGGCVFTFVPNPSVVMILTPVSIIMLLIGSMEFDRIRADEKLNKYKSDKAIWMENVVAPYIETKDTVIKDLVYIKIIHDEKNSIVADEFRFLFDENFVKTRMTVSYKQGKSLITKTGSFEVAMELSDDEQPYIEFLELNEDLGHGINAGLYNPKIYLPASYRFKDFN